MMFFFSIINVFLKHTSFMQVYITFYSLIDAFAWVITLLLAVFILNYWCYLRLSHMIYQSITMRFTPCRRCISL